MKSILLCLMFFLIASNSQLVASPPPTPYDHVICSNNARFCAFESPKEGIKVFKVEGGRRTTNEPLYSIPGYYFGAAYLSDDGDKYVIVQNVIDPDHVNTEPAVQLWVRGKLLKRLHMSDILSKWRAKKSSDGYVWCKTEWFESDGRFIIELINGKRFELKD